VKPDLVLKIQQTTGNNATSVVFNPDRKTYFAVFGGNESFPLEVFDETGKNLHKSAAGFDARGLWWNGNTMQIEGNSYSNHGIITIQLTDKGFPKGVKVAINNNDQPEDQSCGAYDQEKNEIIYFFNDTIYRYNRSSGKYIDKYGLSGIPVKYSCLNKTTVIYTAMPTKEIGLLDHINKKIYLFDKSSGNLTTSVDLPSNAPAFEIYRFAFANDHIWLYDKNKRTWDGYHFTNLKITGKQ
jgi:hypothetical protein